MTPPRSTSGWDAAIARTAGRYRGSGRFDRYYVAGKLRRDPVYAALPGLAEDGFGHVLDVGCGRGQLGVLLLEAGLASSVTGLDTNRHHLEAARQAAQGLAFRAEAQDLDRDAGLPGADTVFLVDVLYQLATEAQFALLTACARAARRRLLVRTADPGQGLRSAASRVLEVVGRRVWPNAGARVNAQDPAALAQAVEAEGLAVQVLPSSQGTPFANVLLAARRV